MALMKNADKHSPIELAILGDLRSLSTAKDSGGDVFLAALDLLPYPLIENSYETAIASLEEQASPASSQEETLTLAICGMAIAETFFGRTEPAKLRLDSHSPTGGDSKLLLSLVRTWLFAELLPDYDDALDAVGSVQSVKLRARSRLKLGVWLLNEGHRDAAIREFERALAEEDESWRHGIEAITAPLLAGPSGVNIRSTPTVPGLEWLVEKADAGARKRLVWLLEQDIEPIGTRTFGRSSAEGSEFHSVEAQLDWVGAAWLWQPIGESIAAAILLSPNPSDAEVIYALSRLVRSGSPLSVKALRKCDGLLNRANVETLAVKSLKRGRLTSRRSWYELCDSVWHLLPRSVLQELVSQIEIPEQNSTSSIELRLFGKLFIAEPALWVEKVQGCSQEQISAAVLALPRMVSWLSSPYDLEILKPLVQTINPDEIRDPYAEANWPNFVALLSALGLHEKILAVMHAASDSELISCAQYLPPAEQSKIAELTMGRALPAMQNQLREGVAGTLRIGDDPYQESAAAAAILRSVSPKQVELLIQTANDSRLPSLYCTSAIRALFHLRSLNLIEAGDFENSIKLRRKGRVNHGFWDGNTDMRLEDVWRSAVHAEIDPQALASLAAGTRDSNREVRAAAVMLAAQLPREISLSAVIDSVILSALYDPAKEVKSTGADAAVRGLVSDQTLEKVTFAYLEENWNHLPTVVKTTVAQRLSSPQTGTFDRLRELARSDDSILVQKAIANRSS